MLNWRPWGVNFDNTKLRVGTNLMAYRIIELDAGVYYQLETVVAAINAAVSTGLGWWADSSDPGLSVVYNEIVDRAVLIIDSTKLNPTYGSQFKLDLSRSGAETDLAQLFGFSTTTVLTSDGEYTGTLHPELNTQGTSAVITADIAPQRKTNNNDVKVIATVRFLSAVDSVDVVWPSSGQLSPTVTYQGPRSIKQYHISIRTAAGQTMVFMAGGIRGCLSFSV